MSPARQYRDRIAALLAAGDQSPVADTSEGDGHPAPTPIAVHDGPITPARKHAMLHGALDAALAAVIAPAAGEADPAMSTPQAQMEMRLIQDLRFLHDTKSMERKIAAKRRLLPEYDAWILGVLAAAKEGHVAESDVTTTIMIWRIDIGDYDGALPLIELVLEHDLKLPARYQRDAASLIVEEIANAAIQLQQTGARFDLFLLEYLSDLTAHVDMHDPIRAKLEKAIGVELLAIAEGLPPEDAGFLAAHQRALVALQLALSHDVRIGVKDRIKRAEKAIAALTPPKDAAASG